jgi:hypothetical protein
MAFNKEEFNASFDVSLTQLHKAEKVTKAILMDLSRSVLVAHHETEDIQYINRVIRVLTPVNRKVAIEYFKVFSGFTFNGEEQIFTKKDKKIYEEAVKKSNDFLDDPLNNIWSWAERNIEIAPKEFTLEAMKKQFAGVLDKATKNNFTQLQVIETFMEAGLSMDTLLALMAKIAGEPAPVDVQES